MRATFVLTVDDLQEFWVAHYQRQNRRQRRWYAPVFMTVFSALPVLILITSDKPLLETAKALIAKHGK